jgi:hypothetical protein
MSFLSAIKSCFFDMDEKEINNMSKGGHKANEHGELWVKNVLNEWNFFQGFNMEKSIVDLSKDEDSMMNLVNMFYFILHVAKKDDSLYPLTR